MTEKGIGVNLKNSVNDRKITEQKTGHKWIMLCCQRCARAIVVYTAGSCLYSKYFTYCTISVKWTQHQQIHFCIRSSCRLSQTTWAPAPLISIAQSTASAIRVPCDSWFLLGSCTARTVSAMINSVILYSFNRTGLRAFLWDHVIMRTEKPQKFDCPQTILR